ncbi:hypothetical protein [Xenorhabdus siamensis]|uniref:hypothetical protein n=1 Tax=Xenorhabdus siamensis TaxID=3136254 RepID=UPI0030F486F6
MKNNNQENNEVFSVRQRVTVIVSELDSGFGVHFCNHGLLSGSNHNLWWPLSESAQPFTEIENIMVMNKIAKNVALIILVRREKKFTDYEVVYNTFEPKT